MLTSEGWPRLKYVGKGDITMAELAYIISTQSSVIRYTTCTFTMYSVSGWLISGWFGNKEPIGKDNQSMSRRQNIN